MYIALELIAVLCGIYGAYATASKSRKERQLGFIVFTIGAVAAVPLYMYKELWLVTTLTIVYIALDIRGIINNRSK